jgi:hypothetical protein
MPKILEKKRLNKVMNFLNRNEIVERNLLFSQKKKLTKFEFNKNINVTYNENMPTS